MNKYELINEILNDDSIIYHQYNVEQYIECKCIMESLNSLSIEDILFAINLYPFQKIGSKEIPMFSKFEDCTFNLCLILDSIGQEGMGFIDLGRSLLGYNAKEMALYKYGETHGKTSSLLGLTVLVKNNKGTKLFLSNLGYYYLDNESERSNLIYRLILHMKIVRNTVKNNTNNNTVDMNEMISCLSKTTIIRRMPNIKRVLTELETCTEYDFSEFLNRLDFSIKR